MILPSFLISLFPIVQLSALVHLANSAVVTTHVSGTAIFVMASETANLVGRMRDLRFVSL